MHPERRAVEVDQALGCVSGVRTASRSSCVCCAMPSPLPTNSASAPLSGHLPRQLKTKALLCSLDHGSRRTDLGLANGAGRVDINDDAELHVEEIVARVREECRSLCARLLGCGSDGETNLRNDIGSRPKGLVLTICLHRAVRRPKRNVDLAGWQIPLNLVLPKIGQIHNGPNIRRA